MTSPVDDSAIDAVRVVHAVGSPRYSQVVEQSTFEMQVAWLPTVRMRTKDCVGIDVGSDEGVPVGAAEGAALGVDDGEADGEALGVDDGEADGEVLGVDDAVGDAREVSSPGVGRRGPGRRAQSAGSRADVPRACGGATRGAPGHSHVHLFESGSRAI